MRTRRREGKGEVEIFDGKGGEGKGWDNRARLEFLIVTKSNASMV